VNLALRAKPAPAPTALKSQPGIGLLNEKPLHASLKAWCSVDGDRFEVAVDGFVVDIVRGDCLVEIQTASFGAIKKKLARLLTTHRVRLIHPVATEKWIVQRDGRRPPTRRKSPKRGRVEDVFRELVSIPHLLTHRNLVVEVLLIREEEARRRARRRWRGPGWAVEERRLLEVVERRVFESSSDWRALLPPGLDSFTAAELAGALKIRRDLAQKIAYVLRHASIVDFSGKRGRSYLYSVPDPNRLTPSDAGRSA
jgi:hypothetical protein